MAIAITKNGEEVRNEIKELQSQQVLQKIVIGAIKILFAVTYILIAAEVSLMILKGFELGFLFLLAIEGVILTAINSIRKKVNQEKSKTKEILDRLFDFIVSLDKCKKVKATLKYVNKEEVIQIGGKSFHTAGLQTDMGKHMRVLINDEVADKVKDSYTAKFILGPNSTIVRDATFAL